MRKKWDLKKWEAILIFFSLILFLGASFLYFLNFPLITYFLGFSDDQNRQKVGAMASDSGEVRRQLNGETDFRFIRGGSPLYERDTVVTGADGSATLALEDGSIIELAPNTMVRLAYESTFALDGIHRAANIIVIAGNVTGESRKNNIVLKANGKSVTLSRNMRQSVKAVAAVKPLAPPPVAAAPSPTPIPLPPPSPSPSPVPPALKALRLVTPANGEKISVPKGSPRAEAIIPLHWTMSPGNIPLVLSLRKIEKNGKPKEILSEKLEVEGKSGKFRWIAKSPGSYEWELKEFQPETEPGPKTPAKGAKAPLSRKARFSVEPQFEGIGTLEPLVGGKPLTSNLIRGKVLKNFDIVLRWEPYRGAKDYRLRLLANESAGRSLLEKRVEKPEFKLNKDKVYTGRIYYQVIARLESGFIVSARPQPFIFNFLPPILVTPKNLQTVSLKKLPKADGNVIFTWQKTNFTDAYLLEVAKDAEFKAPVVQKRLPENYFVWSKPPAGKYYWRVRSHAQTLTSAASPPNEITIAP